MHLSTLCSRAKSNYILLLIARHLDDNLPDLFARLQILVSLFELFELKDLVYQRNDTSGFQRPVHLFELNLVAYKYQNKTVRIQFGLESFGKRVGGVTYRQSYLER